MQKDETYKCDYMTIVELVTDKIVTVTNICGVISILELKYEGLDDGGFWYLSICESDCEVEISEPYFKKLISILKTQENKKIKGTPLKEEIYESFRYNYYQI